MGFFKQQKMAQQDLVLSNNFYLVLSAEFNKHRGQTTYQDQNCQEELVYEKFYKLFVLLSTIICLLFTKLGGIK